MLFDIASGNDYPWDVELAHDVDRRLIRSPDPVATSDSVVLDGVGSWINLAESVLDRIPTSWIVPMDVGR